LAIHAAAKIPPKYLGASRFTEEFVNEIADVLMVRRDRVSSAIEKLPRAVVLCVVKLVEVKVSEQAMPCERERIFGNYEKGRYAWFLEMVEKFDAPIPAKGSRMLWNWSGR
jgi:hypothetical protein